MTTEETRPPIARQQGADAAAPARPGRHDAAPFPCRAEARNAA